MKKLYQLVDENDQIVGYKFRNKIDFKNDIYRSSAVWLTNSKAEILIAQRALNKDKDPGKWGPAVAGTLEKGETYESNAYKETEEEIGLTGVKFKLGPKQRHRDPRQSFCQWYIGVVDQVAEEFKLQEDEVEKVKWVTVEWLQKDLFENPDKYVPSMPSIVALLYDNG